MSDHEHDRTHNAEGASQEKHKKHKKHHHHGAHAEHEHEEGWIVSFADNVLLMMGFFVILLAMNMGPKGSSDSAPSSTAEERLLDVAIAVREAFHNPVSMDSILPEDQALIRRLRDRRKPGAGNTPADAGETPASDGHQDTVGGKGISNVRPSDWQDEADFVQFEDNEVLLSPQAKATISQISRRIMDTRWMVEVRGHASKWETWRDTKKARDLAYERAWVVGNEMVLNGVQWEQIRLVSSGTCAPIIARARTSDEAQTNQRTEILVLREHAPPDPYSNAPVRPEDKQPDPD